MPEHNNYPLYLLKWQLAHLHIHIRWLCHILSDIFSKYPAVIVMIILGKLALNNQPTSFFLFVLNTKKYRKRYSHVYVKYMSNIVNNAVLHTSAPYTFPQIIGIYLSEI